MSKEYFIGIDPGLTGSISLLNLGGKIISIWDYPKRASSLYCLFKDLSLYPNIFALVEKVEFSGFQNIANQMKYAETFYRQVYLLELFCIDYEIVRAKDWKPVFNLAKNKKQSVDVVLKLFPEAKQYIKQIKDHNRAESLLITEYGRRNIKL